MMSVITIIIIIIFIFIFGLKIKSSILSKNNKELIINNNKIPTDDFDKLHLNKLHFDHCKLEVNEERLKFIRKIHESNIKKIS